MVRENGGLVEAAAALSPRMKRYGDDEVGIREELATGREHQAGQWAGERPPALVLERMDDRPERPVVEPSCSSTRDGRGWPAQGMTDSVPHGSCYRKAALLTQRRRDPLNLTPTLVAHHSPGWSVDEAVTGGAAGCPRETQNPITESAES